MPNPTSTLCRLRYENADLGEAFSFRLIGNHLFLHPTLEALLPGMVVEVGIDDQWIGGLVMQDDDKIFIRIDARNR